SGNDDNISDTIKETLNRFFRANDPAKTTALYEEYVKQCDRVLHRDAVDMGTLVDDIEVDSVEKQVGEEDIYEAALSPNSIIFRDEPESMEKELRNMSVKITCIHRTLIDKTYKEAHSRPLLW